MNGNPNEHDKSKSRQRLCRYGKKCPEQHGSCKFSHEMIEKPCKYGTRCQKGDECLFRHSCVADGSHVSRGSEKGGSDHCSRHDNENEHSSGGSGGSSDTNLQRNGRLCKFGRTCKLVNSGECKFKHELINKPCRGGENCTKGDACLFRHNDNKFNNIKDLHSGMSHGGLLVSHGEKSHGGEADAKWLRPKN